MDQNEFNERLKKFEEQIKPIQQQMQSVDQAINDLSSLHQGLDEIKEGQEILAPIGKGIFVKAKTLSEKLTVDVGGKKYVKKEVPETKTLIKDQLDKLQEVQGNLNQELEKINQQLTETMLEYQSGQ